MDKYIVGDRLMIARRLTGSHHIGTLEHDAHAVMGLDMGPGL
jgi:hypothetical protein